MEIDDVVREHVHAGCDVMVRIVDPWDRTCCSCGRSGWREVEVGRIDSPSVVAGSCCCCYCCCCCCCCE